MIFKRLLRTVLCLVVICCLVLNLSPLRAHATAAVAPVVSSVAAVSVPGALVVGAALIALGVYAGTKTETFEYLTQNAVNFLDTAGGWVKDGSMELLKTVNSVGKATYYVANDLLETLRGWIYDDVNKSTFSRSYNSMYTNQACSSIAEALSYASHCPAAFLCHNGSGIPSTVVITNDSSYVSLSNGTLVIQGYGTNHSYYTLGSDSWSRVSSSMSSIYSNATRLSTTPLLSTRSDLTIGTVSSVPIDGTSARDWSEEYADRRLYVVDSGGSGDPGDDDDGDHSGKWFWPLAGALTAGELYLLSQADEWSADTPSEFPEDDTKTDFDILDRPEVDGLPGIEISPAQDATPDTGGNSDGSIDATTGSDAGSEGSSDKDYTSWLSRILAAIQEIPSKFQSWLSDLKTAITELPSKFADWFQNLSQGLSNIWDELKTIPQKIADAIGQALQTLFVPAEGYLQTKVDALAEAFPFAESIAETGLSLKSFFVGLGSKPPIIYIDLGAATGWYAMGGKVAFLDLTWYAQYKPTMDIIISAFLWLWFAWRMLLSLPGILKGVSGVWGNKETGSKAGKEVSEQ